MHFYVDVYKTRWSAFQLTKMLPEKSDSNCANPKAKMETNTSKMSVSYTRDLMPCSIEGWGGVGRRKGWGGGKEEERGRGRKIR